MDEKSLQIFRELADLCASFEEALKRFRERVASLALESVNWKVVEAPSPLNPEDKALKWLEKRLNQVREKHPEIKVEWIKDDAGRILGLRYHAPDEEVEGDILGPTKWSFEKAAQRPVSTSNKS